MNLTIISYLLFFINSLIIFVFSFPSGCERKANVLDCSEKKVNTVLYSGYGLKETQILYLQNVNKLEINWNRLPMLNFLSIERTSIHCEMLGRMVPKIVTIEINGNICLSNTSSSSTSSHLLSGYFSTRRAPKAVIFNGNPTTSSSAPYMFGELNGTRKDNTTNVTQIGGLALPSLIVMVSLGSFVLACISVIGIIKCRCFNRKETFVKRKPIRTGGPNSESEQTIIMQEMDTTDLQLRHYQSRDVENLSFNSSNEEDVFAFVHHWKMKSC